MKSVKYLQKVKEKFDLKTDTALATKLGWSKAAVSMYMSEKRVMDEEACLATALALDINPLEVIAAAGIDRAEKTGQRSLWEVFMSRTAIANLAVLALSVNLFLTPQETNAAVPDGNSQFSNLSSLQPINYA